MRFVLSSVVVCTLAAALAGPVSAQPQRDALFFELGGPGGAFTISYERAIGRISPRLGVGATPFSLHAPVMATYRFSDRRGRFEAGAGAIFAAVSSASEQKNFTSHVWPAATFAYRLDFADAPLAFRAAFTPIWEPGSGIAPWIGLGIGVSFDRRHAVLR